MRLEQAAGRLVEGDRPLRAARSRARRRAGTAVVGRDRVAVVQGGGVDGELLVGREDGEVGVAADGDRAPWRSARRSAAGRCGHPAHDVGQGEAAARRLGPHRRQAELQRGDAAPGGAEVAGRRALEVRGAGRVVGDHEVDHAVAQRPPQPFAVLGLADRRAALELGGAVGDLLGVEDQVVRAGLDGQRGRRRRLAAAIIGSASASERWTMCTRAPVRRAASMTVAIARALGRPRAGGEEARRSCVPCAGGRRDRSASASSAWTIISASSSASSGQVALEVGRPRARGTPSTPEGSRKHLNPKTPASCSGCQVVDVAGDRAAPEPDVDVALTGRGLALDLQGGGVDGGRDAVERHVEQGGDAAGRRGPGGAWRSPPTRCGRAR